MGSSHPDAGRQVGVFPLGLFQRLSAERAAVMEKFRWIAGDWSYENRVPATRLSPAYSDTGNQTFSLCEGERWVCIISPGGLPQRHITFDPLSKQWIYVVMRGAYGILRSPDGWSGNQIVFSGLMTMLGINFYWRMTWTRVSDDEFGFVNEELEAGGSRAYMDEWRFRRTRAVA